MDRFKRCLLVSDFDNTLQFTEETLRTGRPLPPVSPRNLEAIRRWMAEGGYFTVATGRTLDAFRRQAEGIPMNAPVIVDNGGAVYDWEAETYLVKNFLAPGAAGRIAGVLERFPAVSLELYREGGLVEVLRETDWNRQHALLTGLPYRVVERLEDRGELRKALFVAERAELERVRSFIAGESWSGDYQLIFSTDHLLELTAQGADKGKMALWLKERLGCKKLFCAGDQANDLPMLRTADRAFAPANAAAEVRASGAELVCHCVDGAIGDAVALLERELG